MVTRRISAGGVALALLTLVPAEATSQSADSSLVPGRTVVATPQGRYAATGLQRFLLGDGHRDLWPMPVTVEVLDLDRFAGGLSVLREGGGLQTRSLRFQGADGQVWNFRSVDKDASRALDPELRNTIAEDVMQDRISAIMPLSAMVVAPLLDAVDVLHPDPTLVVMPDDARLGTFRGEFAGLLGWMEVRPDEGGEETAGFAGSFRVIGTDRLLERLEDSPNDVIDGDSYVRARLMDVLVGDWDRHPDQWRWAGFPAGPGIRFEPVPRDRDWALSRLDGVVGSVSWAFWPHYVGFQEELPSAFRATWSARVLDRRLLSASTRDRFRAVAADLQARLTDSVIERSVAALPEGYRAAIGDELIRGLENRRNDLSRFADEWYDLLAGWVDVHVTDEDEVAELTRMEDGAVRVVVTLAGEGSPAHFERLLLPDETKELRLYMHGGHDRVVVSGAGPSDIKLRILGGGGDDTFVSRARNGGGTYFYDDRGDNTFDRGAGARVDEREFEEPFDPSETTHQAPFRDWGSRWLPVPTISYDADLGLFLGFGGIRTGYGFRAYPYNTRLAISAGTGLQPERFRAAASYDFPVLSQSFRGNLVLFASGAEARRFYGFGNDTEVVGGEEPGDHEFFLAEQREFRAELPLGVAWGPARYARVGPIFKRFEPFAEEPTFVSGEQPYGARSFNEAGLVGAFGWDSFDRRLAPRAGWLVHLEGRYFPALLDLRSAFGGVRGWAAGVLTLPAPSSPTLAARVGGERVWGDAPYQEAAYLGGLASLRGYRKQRFAGHGSVFLNAEMRFKIARLKILLPEDVGVYALTDVGRVFAEEPSNTWHTSFGGGAWMTLMDVFSVNVSVAASREQTLLYFLSGFAFGT